MIKYNNLKSENVENPEKVIKDFSRLVYGNDAGSVEIDGIIERAMKRGLVESKEKKFVFYTYLTIDGFEKKYYKACGTDLTTNKAKAWFYTKADLDFYEAYKKQYEVEEIEEEEI